MRSRCFSGHGGARQLIGTMSSSGNRLLAVGCQWQSPQPVTEAGSDEFMMALLTKEKKTETKVKP